MARPDSILVVGGGVVGLTTAVVLSERFGRGVRLVAREFSPHTTSDVAAALWHPYLAEPRDRVHRWSLTSYRRFAALAKLVDAPRTCGVTMREGVECFPGDLPPAGWRHQLPNLRRAELDDLPSQSAATGFRFAAPVAQMPIYLDWLRHELVSRGGHIETRHVTDLSSLDAAVIVHCAGLGASELTSDDQLQPIRGQVVRVRAPGVDRFLVDESGPDPLYIVPRGDDCILGGTVHPGSRDLEVRNEETADVLSRAIDRNPRLRHAEVLEAKVGLRPGRTKVRVERDPTSTADRQLIHNYGHGGSGMTLSWGCAEEVADII